MGRQQRPVPPPLEGDDRLITAVITAGFLAALIVLLIVRDKLAPADRWWVWVAALGTGMGLFGFAYVPHLKRSRSRAAQRRQAAQDDNCRASMDGRGAASRSDRDYQV